MAPGHDRQRQLLLGGIKATKVRSTRLRRLAVVFVAVCFFMLVVMVRRTDRRPDELKFFIENQRILDGVNATVCKLPAYDLYDPEVAQYTQKPPNPIVCGDVQPYLTYMDRDGMLYLNLTELKRHNYKDLTCTYEEVIGDRMNDYKVSYERPTEIRGFPVEIRTPVVRVKCADGGAPIYVMIHSQITPPERHAIDRNKAIPAHRPSVLIFTIDSMSRGNFIRSLPKTYNYLLSQHGMFTFKGLNKVADNTFPNMMALLAGFMNRKRDDMPHMPTWTIKDNSSMKRYDDMPIIWNTFQKDGYVTMYAEEYLDATFSLLDVGFLNDPVDYYYRSSYVSIKENLGVLNRANKFPRAKWMYCVGNEPSYRYLMNYTEEFLTEMADLKYFAFSFLVEVSHDVLNDIKNLDAELLSFFKKMFDGGMFKNTVILIMGDHGHRFDAIRSTFIGRIEERMPFLGIVLPKSLRKSHPHLSVALKEHSERLLSWYDIHEMLVDFSLDDIDEKPKYVRPQAIGKSILRPFDNNRTCTEIGILPEYCMCDREAEISANSPKAFESADIIIENINKLLENSKQFLKKGEKRSCAVLQLRHILSASVSMKSFSAGSTLLVRVILEAYPSKARFEAAVEYSPSSVPHLIGDVNRINKYGSQPDCISHEILRMYCYCK